MYLYHVFHGQAIRIHWMPAKLCENCHCEYNDLILLLSIAVALGNLIICSISQSAFACRLSAISSSYSLPSLSLSFKAVVIAIKPIRPQ